MLLFAVQTYDNIINLTGHNVSSTNYSLTGSFVGMDPNMIAIILSLVRVALGIFTIKRYCSSRNIIQNYEC